MTSNGSQYFYPINTTALRNRGDGVLSLDSNFAVGVGATALALGDMDHDGKLDVWAATKSRSGLTVAFNRSR